MSSFTNQQVDAAACKRFKEKSADWVDGPSHLGSHAVWRIWTYNGDDYQARYAVEDTAGSLVFFESIPDLCNWINSKFDLHGYKNRTLNSVPIWVAAAVVIAGMALISYIAITGPQQSFPLTATLTAVLGGGAGYLFARRPTRP
ncbi:hypothetical protein [Caulobacter flavus]|uniref:hypothetical protein n=1 Tax=Caulobacter flavus TaxID=1679497 RepID=UPI0011AF0F00|nr:hypothetical protein [Caulobacter flavus]